MNNNLLILGAGEFGQFVKEIAEETCQFELIDFLDDNSKLAKDKISNFNKYVNLYNYAVVAIGNPSVRLDLINKLENVGFHIATIISPKAYVSKSSVVSKGTIIEPNATIQSNTIVGVGCIISSNSCIRHNSSLEEGCHIDCNSVVTSHSIVKSKTKVKCGGIYELSNSGCAS